MDIIRSRTIEYVHSTSQPHNANSSTLINIKWFPPLCETFKLNTDGSFLSATEGGGIGGVICDHNCQWIVGFSKHTLGNNHVMLEIEALLQGLRLVVNLNLNVIEIENDSTEILQVLQQAHPIYSTLVNDCRSLMKKLGNPLIHHNFRQANKVAYFLSKMGAKLTLSIPDANISTPPNLL